MDSTPTQPAEFDIKEFEKSIEEPEVPNETISEAPLEAGDQLQMNEETKKGLEERYKEMIQDLVYNHGFSPRKARRYLESEARRNARRMIRAGKRRQAELRRQGKLVDTSGIAEQLDAELAEQLKELSANEGPIATETPEYKPPTKEF